jgi:hypothetical protein
MWPPAYVFRGETVFFDPALIENVLGSVIGRREIVEAAGDEDMEIPVGRGSLRQVGHRIEESREHEVAFSGAFPAPCGLVGEDHLGPVDLDVEFGAQVVVERGDERSSDPEGERVELDLVAGLIRVFSRVTRVVDPHHQAPVSQQFLAKAGLVDPEVRVLQVADTQTRVLVQLLTTSLASIGIVREKETGTLEQLIVTPIRPYQLIPGKLTPFVLIGFIEAAFVVAVAKWWFLVPVRGSVPLLFALCLAFMLNTLGIGLFISTISRTQQQAMFTSMFFILPQILLSGFVFPIENMPKFFQSVTHIVPIRYFFVIIRGIMLRGAGWPELWDQAAWLLALGTVILSLSVLRFHKKLE